MDLSGLNRGCQVIDSWTSGIDFKATPFFLRREGFPGLRLNVPKLLAGDAAGVLAELGRPPVRE